MRRAGNAIVASQKKSGKFLRSEYSGWKGGGDKIHSRRQTKNMRVFGCVKPLDELSELKKIHLGGKVTRLREAIVSEKCCFF